MKTLKKGTVTEDIKRLKSKEARDIGVQDFFTERDKSKRKTAGLVNDSANILGEEIEIKQELYDKSLEVSSLPSYIAPMFTGVFLTAKKK